MFDNLKLKLKKNKENNIFEIRENNHFEMKLFTTTRFQLYYRKKFLADMWFHLEQLDNKDLDKRKFYLKLVECYPASEVTDVFSKFLVKEDPLEKRIIGVLEEKKMDPEYLHNKMTVLINELNRKTVKKIAI